MELLLMFFHFLLKINEKGWLLKTADFLLVTLALREHVALDWKASSKVKPVKVRTTCYLSLAKRIKKVALTLTFILG